MSTAFICAIVFGILTLLSMFGFAFFGVANVRAFGGQMGSVMLCWGSCALFGILTTISLVIGVWGVAKPYLDKMVE